MNLNLNLNNEEIETLNEEIEAAKARRAARAEALKEKGPEEMATLQEINDACSDWLAIYEGSHIPKGVDRIKYRLLQSTLGAAV